MKLATAPETQECSVLLNSTTLAEALPVLADEIERLLALINSPHTSDFLEAVRTEAAHQRERWAADHDAGKTDADWFWLIGYLAGKALNKPEKQLHHIITTAAACLNWHAAKTGNDTRMRPGIEPPADPTPPTVDGART